MLSSSEQEKFLLKSKKFESKDNNRYVCKSCRTSIANDRFPKNNEREKERFQDFPLFFKNKLKKISNYLSVISKRKLDPENKSHVDQALQLNKLEAHLLKLVLPFVRVAHCPRGFYFKVKGGLILISADIPSSLTKILPQSQKLIPVCLKRKLEYKGNYIEEVIDKEKVKAYFEFFKEYNPLFKDVTLNENLIDDYENISVNESIQFNRKKIEVLDER